MARVGKQSIDAERDFALEFNVRARSKHEKECQIKNGKGGVPSIEFEKDFASEVNMRAASTHGKA